MEQEKEVNDSRYMKRKKPLSPKEIEEELEDVDEKDIRRQVHNMVYDYLQKSVSMQWIRDVVKDEVEKQVKISIKVVKK